MCCPAPSPHTLNIKVRKAKQMDSDLKLIKEIFKLDAGESEQVESSR